MEPDVYFVAQLNGFMDFDKRCSAYSMNHERREESLLSLPRTAQVIKV